MRKRKLFSLPIKEWKYDGRKMGTAAYNGGRSLLIYCACRQLRSLAGFALLLLCFSL